MLKKLSRKQIQYCSKYYRNATKSNSSVSNRLNALRKAQTTAFSGQNEIFPDETRVVVCGGGVMGAAVAYHLAEMGWGPHTVVLEQGRLVI